MRSLRAARDSACLPIGFSVGERAGAGQGDPATKLVFLFANPNDQIEIGGASAYSATAQTRPKKSVTIRRIVGGSGVYAGASGWVESIHYADGDWTHRLHLER